MFVKLTILCFPNKKNDSDNLIALNRIIKVQDHFHFD